jgi:hypothetical protein
MGKEALEQPTCASAVMSYKTASLSPVARADAADRESITAGPVEKAAALLVAAAITASALVSRGAKLVAAVVVAAEPRNAAVELAAPLEGTATETPFQEILDQLEL